MTLVAEMRTNEAKDLRVAVEGLETLVDEAVFVANESGISVSAIDPNHAALVFLSIEKKFFSSYSCEEACEIPLNTEELRKVIARAGGEDTVSFHLKREENKFYVTHTGNGVKREFGLSLRSLEDFQRLPHDLALTTRTSLQPKRLKEFIADMDVVARGGNVILEANKSSLSFRASSANERGARVEIEEDDETVITNHEVSEASTSAYGLDYLRKIVKVDSVAIDSVIEFGTSLPLKMTFDIRDGLQVGYLLAPWEEEDESDYDYDYEAE